MRNLARRHKSRTPELCLRAQNLRSLPPSPEHDLIRKLHRMAVEWAQYFEYPRYPLVVPPLGGGVEIERHRVVIIGAGPTGMTLALELASYGVASLVLEADDRVCLGSRATCISRRSLEILTRIGAQRQFLAKGLGWIGGRSFYRNTEVFQLQMRHDENQKFPPMINLQQCYTEKFLIEAVE